MENGFVFNGDDSFTGQESTTVVPLFTLKKNNCTRSIAGVTCLLSIIGSLVIILSYLFFKDLRTNARLLLVHLSVSDLAVSLANFSGEVTHFGRYFQHSKHDYKTNLTPKVFDYLCKIQAFIAHYFTISSVLWTLVLSIYMYVVITRLSKLSKRENRYFNLGACLICYGVALLNCLWMHFTNRLGFSPYSTSGWCGTIAKDIYQLTVDYYALVFGYDIWIVLTSLFIIITYLSLAFQIRQEKKRRSDFKELSRSIDYKFIFIPVAFVFLRIWSFLHNVLMESHHRDSHILDNIFIYLSGIGDSGQGITNCILFVIFTHNVRHRYINLFHKFCCYLCKRSRDENKKCLVVNNSHTTTDSFESSGELSRSIHSKPKFIKNPIPPANKVQMVAKSCDTSTTYGSVRSSFST